jgi:hypothetical protein
MSNWQHGSGLRTSSWSSSRCFAGFRSNSGARSSCTRSRASLTPRWPRSSGSRTQPPQHSSSVLARRSPRASPDARVKSRRPGRRAGARCWGCSSLCSAEERPPRSRSWQASLLWRCCRPRACFTLRPVRRARLTCRLSAPPRRRLLSRSHFRRKRPPTKHHTTASPGQSSRRRRSPALGVRGPAVTSRQPVQRRWQRRLSRMHRRRKAPVTSSRRRCPRPQARAALRRPPRQERRRRLSPWWKRAARETGGGDQPRR